MANQLLTVRQLFDSYPSNFSFELYDNNNYTGIDNVIIKRRTNLPCKFDVTT